VNWENNRVYNKKNISGITYTCLTDIIKNYCQIIDRPIYFALVLGLFKYKKHKINLRLLKTLNSFDQWLMFTPSGVHL